MPREVNASDIAALAGAAPPGEIGRLTGKTGAGLALVAVSLIAPLLAPHLPPAVNEIVASYDGVALAAGISLAGVGAIDKARKIAVWLRTIADAIDRLPRQ